MRMPRPGFLFRRSRAGLCARFTVATASFEASGAEDKADRGARKAKAGDALPLEHGLALRGLRVAVHIAAEALTPGCFEGLPETADAIATTWERLGDKLTNRVTFRRLSSLSL
jgi:hypothetical protein